MENRLIGVEDVINALGVSEEEIVELINNEGLPAYKLGGELKFKAADFDEWLRDCSMTRCVRGLAKERILEMVFESRDRALSRLNRGSGSGNANLECIVCNNAPDEATETGVDIDTILEHAEDAGKNGGADSPHECGDDNMTDSPGYDVVENGGAESVELAPGFSIRYKIFETHVRISSGAELTDELFDSFFTTASDLGLIIDDEDALRKSLTDNQGEWVRIPESSNPFKKKINIVIAEDGLRAYMVACSTDNSGVFTEFEVRDALQEAGVAHGVDNEAIAAASESAMFGHVVPVASGEPPIPGAGPSVDYKVDLDSALTAGIIAAEDFNASAAGQYVSVYKGDILAKMNDAKEGTPGMDVFARECEAVQDSGESIETGRNVEWSEDGRTLAASADGYVLLNGNEISVEPVHFESRDVSSVRGGVDFAGIVVIDGFVRTGTCVKAASHIVIRGGVESAEVKSRQGNVIIKLGIQGRERANIEAAGDVSARFIDKSTVSAGGDVRVDQEIINSTITAGGEVSAIGEKGRIIGGVIVAHKRVRTRFAGSDSSVETKITVEMRETLHGSPIRDVLNSQREKVAAEVSKITTSIERMKMKVFDEKKDIAVVRQIESARARARKLNDIINRINEDIARLNRSYGPGGDRFIEILDAVYPNVNLEIEGLKMSFRKQEKGALFCCGPEKFLVRKENAA